MTVVVTSAGLVSSLGDTPASFHQALCEGRSGQGPVDHFDCDRLPRADAFPIADFSPREHLGPGNLRALDRTSRLATCGVQKALDAGTWGDNGAREGLGLVLGTMFGSIRTISEFDRRCLEAGPQYVKPLDFANSVINAAAGQAAIWHRLPGINATLTGGPMAGLQAIGYGADRIRRGRSRSLLAGGAEELSFEASFGFTRAGQVADDGAPRPFSDTGEGFLLGEGAAFLVLEEGAAAGRRGAAPLAEVRGQGNAFDASRGEHAERAVATATRAIGLALEEAGLAAGDIAAVFGGASGWRPGDQCEADALARIFGARVPVTAIKALVGECLGASGGLQAVAALETLRTGQLPGTPGTTDAMAGLDVPSTARALDRPENLLITAAGFDGNHYALILGRAT
ncbi:MAG: beta-ketoacyl synthase N-terminal-like domain-containing protein [Acidobacteriota bacterium]